MKPFTIARASDQADALARAARGARYIAGGTTLVDLMREGVENPAEVVDINGLPLRRIRAGAAGLEIGALARMSDVAAHPEVARSYPVIAQALLLSASAQLRNMASIGGNLLQGSRCTYFRDASSACNRRVPGSGCPARDGENRTHAILGTSEACVATHPSDLAVALMALDATVRVVGRSGQRAIRLADFYRLPGKTPHVQNALAPGELIVAVDVPGGEHTRRSGYLKVRDRQSYEFALVSAAVALSIQQGVIREARVAAGGVGTRPWRLAQVERKLAGARPGREAYAAAAALAIDGARPLAHNGFKVALLPRTIVRALEMVGGTP